MLRLRREAEAEWCSVGLECARGIAKGDGGGAVRVASGDDVKILCETLTMAPRNRELENAYAVAMSFA
jgi:hypothetical protein